MGIARGTNIVRDGLVFGYDTGYGIADNSTSTRFYPGEPADNLLFKTGAVNLTTGGDIYANAVKTSLGNGRYKFVNDSTGSTTIRLYCNLSDLTDGQSYAISVFYEELLGSISADWCDTTLTNYNNNNGRIIGIGTRSTYTSTYRFLDINLSNGGSVILSNPQVESNSHQTPFIDGTRSNTASLIDLKRNLNIDVSSVSFDSTGQPTFDGTDDKISSGITTQLNDFSCVVVFKDGGSAIWGRLVDKAYTNGFFMSPRWNGNSSHVGAGVIEPNAPHGQYLSYDNTKYNYFAITRSGATHTIYLNGSSNTSQKTNGSTAALGTSDMTIGAWYDNRSSQRYTGEIPVVKLYNKQLSAAEIEQDFKAYKNRFNL